MKGAISFENVNQKLPISFPCLPLWKRRVRVEAGFSKQCLPVPLSPSPLCSGHSDHTAVLTSLPQPFPAFCLNPADSTAAQVTLVQYDCAETSLDFAHMFYSILLIFLLEVESGSGSVKKCQWDQNVPEIILTGPPSGLLTVPFWETDCESDVIFMPHSHKQKWKRVRNFLFNWILLL